MTAYSGPAPWHDSFKRVTNTQAAKHGVRHVIARKQFKTRGGGTEWRLTSGWTMDSEEDAWDDPNAKKPNYKTFRVLGRNVRVPIGDYNGYIGHSGPSSLRDTAPDGVTIREYIEGGFGRDSVSKNRGGWSPTNPDVTKWFGAGHIAQMSYNHNRQLLWVDFKPNDYSQGDYASVVYFRVPANVAAQLRYHSEQGDTFVGMDGKVHHVLGQAFWDLIRQRGPQTGSKGPYEFTYTKGAPENMVSARSVPAEKKVLSAFGVDSQAEYIQDYADIAQAAFRDGVLTAEQMAKFNLATTGDAMEKWLIENKVIAR